MATTAQQLIARSWYLSGIESRELQSISGDRLNIGLDLLNSLFNFKQAETDLLPYYTLDEAVSTVAGQEEYFIENCAQIDALSFDLNNVRYTIRYVHRDKYFAGTRVNNIQSLPFNYTYIREAGGVRLYLYFLPDAVYNLNIYGKFYLADVSLNTDLETTLDKAYIEYLRYALADYMCQEYGVSLPPRTLKILEQYKHRLKTFSPPDVSVHKAGLSMKGKSAGWTFINFFNGWVP